jgi:hypothetical protein
MKLSILPAAIVMVLFCGCAVSETTTGVDFDLGSTKSIRRGKSNRQTIEVEFGVPYGRSFGKDGTEAWEYYYKSAAAVAGSYGGMTAAKGTLVEKHLTIDFDSTGIVESFSYSGALDSRSRSPSRGWARYVHVRTKSTDFIAYLVAQDGKTYWFADDESGRGPRTPFARAEVLEMTDLKEGEKGP